MSRPLEIDLLRSFAVIAEVRSLSRAAERVGRTQSALSQQIKRLEEIVDQPLFQRTGRGVALTHPGERLLVHAQRILRLHDEAMADLCGTGLSGTIRFGCPDDYAAVFLPSLLRQFSSQHPHALVEVVCVPTPRLVEQLDKRAVDLAMVSLPLTARGTDDEIIRREQLVWIGSPELDAAHFDPLPLALSDPDTLDHIAACEALERTGRAYRVAYASSSLAGLTALVRSGQAFAVMTQTAVPQDLAILNGDPALPPLPAVGITIKFGRKRPSLLTAAFAEHIRLTLPLL
ncbi:LysR family transcriptional regulator [Paraburkholderia silvatlantica]|uniref:DNA-binding transcriptional LysR family regulator n=1 Tax=Paraburkholderia silvatlantica TaxID=321895 RepID=A0A2U1A4W7_9BURK|nr:LysR family transcriptional regulator [Paraburkholderia silvatlantica]MBB2931567.1 DNA-binding transcriptional LysR family regulator [Paraburkholderia silvatlantica]PVY26641.1 LysR family transcriptional regulator [Paraburkholderia silvatlantica]PXW32906.1 LysR family transcriptional regulator [Paraburkholderia silvatlantica]PYE14435.1 LysR family transcriptional regulator [Paraburkholderia silvatlantica]TDQ81656.1 LysR family transcriptional regulator [Paraburkholderia silvatlantica]